MNYNAVMENVIETKTDTFYVPYVFINTYIDKFLQEPVGALKSVKISPSVKCESGTIMLMCESVQLLTGPLNLNGETVVFDNFLMPGHLNTKITVNCNTKNTNDILIKFEVEYVMFKPEFMETLKYQKIEQTADFEVEFQDVYTRDESNIIQHSIKKVYKPCDIIIQNKSIRKTIVD